MIKELLEENEKIIYQSMVNVFKSGNIPQTLLLAGPSNPLKKEAAVFLAQSIIEDHNDLACEECERCQRIKAGNYYDVYLIAGEGKILKDDIERLLEEFHQTALERDGKKVFVIYDIDTANPKAANMILKSIEEPMPGNYWIFTSDREDAVLPTIASRCLIWRFHRPNIAFLQKKYAENSYNMNDAYILARLFHEYRPFDIHDKAYVLAKEMLERTVDSMSRKGSLEMFFINEWYPLAKKEADVFNKSQDYYLDMMIILLHDAIKDNQDYDEWYADLLKQIKAYDLYKMTNIFYEIKDLANTNAERRLLFDRLAYSLDKMEERK